MLLFLVACGGELQPPPPPDQPNTMDTASPAPEAEEKVERPRERLPEVDGIIIGPHPLRSLDDAVLKVGADLGSARARIVWSVNGKEIYGADRPNLPHSRYKKGDRVDCTLIVSKGDQEIEVRADTVTVGNSPPEILTKQSDFLNGVDGVRMRAEDPDGDPLTWRLEQAPPGMSIDADGKLHFSGTDAQSEGGNFETKIIVEDSSGEWVAWPLKLNLKGGKKTERKLPGQ